MKNLLYKEIKLAVHPSLYIFLSFGILLLIPSWPFFIAFGYIIIGFMNTFYIGRTNQDIFFTASLPVRKSDAVRARIFTMAAFEILQIILAVPFAILNTMINPHGNQAGMNPNIAFFGFIFAMYAIFNVIFIPRFYKTADKVGAPVLLAVLAVLVYVPAVEFAVHVIPDMKTKVNAFGINHLTTQLLVLIAGVAIFALLTGLAVKKAVNNFEKVDL